MWWLSLKLYKSYCQFYSVCKTLMLNRKTMYVLIHIYVKRWNQDRSFGKTALWNKTILKGEFKYLSQDVLQALGGSFHQLWVIHKPSESRESFPICLNVLSKTCKLKQPWGSKQWSVLLLAWIFIANESKRCDWVGYCPCQMQYIQCSGNLPLLRCLFYSRYFFLNYKHNIF